MSDIVERLLARKHYDYEQGSRYPEYQGPHDPLCKEAADLIERQAAEIEMLQHDITQLCSIMTFKDAEIERLRAELNGRLGQPFGDPTKT